MRVLTASIHGLLLMLFGVLPPPCWAVDFPEFPIAEFMRLSVAADNIQFNGVPIRIADFRSDKSEAAVVAFYRETWKEEIADADYAMWRILSHREGDFLLTVQVSGRGGAGSGGTLSIAPVFSPNIEPGKDLGKGFPLLPGTTVVNDIQARDGPNRSRTLLMVNGMSVRQNRDYYSRRFLREGWREMAGNRDENGDPMENPPLILSRGRDELNIAFTVVDGKTHTVAVLVQQ